MSNILTALYDDLCEFSNPDGEDIALFLNKVCALNDYTAYYEEDEDEDGNTTYTIYNESLDKHVTINYDGYIVSSSQNSRNYGFVLEHIWQAARILLNVTFVTGFNTYGEDERAAILRLVEKQWAYRSPVLSYLVNTFNLRSVHQIYKKDLPSYWSWAYPEQTGFNRKQLINDQQFQPRLNGDHWNVMLVAASILNGTYYVVQGKFFEPPRGTSATNEAPCSILNYSTKVESILKVDIKKGQTLFGIELELDKVNPAKLQQAHDILKSHCIFKRDGSVSNGVEIVSKPDTIANHKEIFHKFLVDGKAAELVATNCCGIHIHVSRGHMSYLTLGRINAFMNTNREKVQTIAGRSSSYAQFNQNNQSQGLLNPWYQVSGDKYGSSKKFNWDKYTCLNLAPAHTMEFRIFKATTDWEEFCRFLEFTESVVEYCCLAGNDNKGKIRNMKDLLDFSNYAAFVAARGSNYSSLNKFIKKKFA